MTNPHSPPNIVVVVLDCVRASDFPGGSAGLRGMPFCESLSSECVRFPRATSPAPWTIPSHASLFTGLGPWESGCHWKGSLKLAPEIPRLPTLLASAGYRTMSLSANPIIQPMFGLADGFQSVAWSGWWEPFLRTGSTRAGNQIPTRAGAKPSVLARARKGGLSQLVTESRAVFVKHPVTLESMSRFVQRFRGAKGSASANIATWIEPTFREWLAQTPVDRPVFAFLNLLDAHEPYFRSDPNGESSTGWVTYARLRQEWLGWLTGDWHPTSADLELLHKLYRGMIRSMDRRLELLVAALRETGRWDDTLLIVTSDHGQAFGEHGTLFHMLRVDDPLIRIPLWVRFPRGEHGGTRAVGWTSLIDIAPTALELATGRPKAFPSAVPINSLFDRERARPAVSVSDGIVWNHFREKFSEEQMRKFDRVWAAAYSGSTKVVVDVEGGQITAYDVDSDPMERTDLWGSQSDALGGLAEAASQAGRLTAGVKRDSIDPEVMDRLRAWGYV